MSTGWRVALSLAFELALAIAAGFIFRRPGWRSKLASIWLVVFAFAAFISTVLFTV